jgi:hypothetical protein
MNIQKKIKVIYSVFFTDEIDYLLFRFTELNDSVDLFIILEASNNYDGSPRFSVFEEHIDKFEPWKEKIIHVKSSNPSEEELKEILSIHKLKKQNIIKDSKDEFLVKQLHDFKIKLDSIDLSFDDIIMVSNIDEFPVIPPIEILQTHLSFEPIFFLQKDFIWSKNFIKSENHLGTLCFSYSHIVTGSLMFSLYLSKNHDSRLNLTPLNFGYRFSYFNSIEKNVEKIASQFGHQDLEKLTDTIKDSMDNLVYYDLSTLSNKRPLKKYDGELPSNIDILDSQKIGREVPKKYLVVFGIDSTQGIQSDDYDNIMVITKSNNLTYSGFKKISENSEIYYIPIPTKKYYDILIEDNTLENFQKMYFLNEVGKILYSKYPINVDEFTFYYGGKYITYKWSEIKHEFIYDLLHK